MTNRHHLFWPKKDYKSPLEYEFRNLPCLIVEMNWWTHNLLHQVQDPPKKPTPGEMHRAIREHHRGHCSCQPVNQNVGNVTYLSNGRRMVA